MAKQDDYVRYTIRVPADLYEQIREAAGDKSVNAEIIDRLQRSFLDHWRFLDLSEAGLAALLKRLEATVSALESMTMLEARQAVDEYLREQIAKGKRASPSEVVKDILAWRAEKQK